ncbi:twin transmembrane helix small protein [Rubellimicrobium sp. CFH 75288]|uniref:twin transmembrane helix small protein n=1 Tax=Rubellimicrobium sp. CFH 75288 TaxID=2697034 RepID=UPI001412E680|nr:twin transmembrane helix small protein [Rubellimicrobium sp. CFH 75288]NAZ36755.1 twin transmembrane helix small protein [Rubellimicrobium sp. CFH 75288]
MDFRDPFFLLLVFAVLVVAAILLVGIGSFGRGGEFNRRHANRLMRWRIYAQGVAVALIVLYVWLRSRGAT